MLNGRRESTVFFGRGPSVDQKFGCCFAALKPCATRNAYKMWRSPSGLRSRLCCQQLFEKGCGRRMRIAGCAAEAEPAGAAHCGVERRQTTVVLDVKFGPTI